MFPAQWVRDIIDADRKYPIPEIGGFYVVEEPHIAGHGSPPSEVGDIIQVTGGQYYGTYGLSNFWDWRRLREDGTFDGAKFCGYGGIWRPIADPRAKEVQP